MYTAIDYNIDNNTVSNEHNSSNIIKRCTCLKVNGTKCNGIAIKNTGKCVTHTRTNGNLSVKNRPASGIDRGNSYIKVFIAHVIRQIKQGKIKPNDANAIFNGCQKLIEINNIEREDALFKQLMEKVNKSKAIAGESNDDIIDMVE